jgi:DNA-binding response OmpR family regulator
MPKIGTIACVAYDKSAVIKLKLHLQNAGYTVVAANTLSYALAIVTSIVLDAILLSDMLPDRDAREILTRLKQANRRAHIVSFSHRTASIDDTSSMLAA